MSPNRHRNRVTEQADLLAALGYTEIRADHTDRYPDPRERNNRIPDVTADGPFCDPVIEVDTGTRTSVREATQLNELEEGLLPGEELFHVEEDDPLFGQL